MNDLQRSHFGWDHSRNGKGIAEAHNERSCVGTLHSRSATRARLLFGQPERRFQSAKLIRLARSGTGAVHRQLQRLEHAGLVTISREGNQKYYAARTDASIFAELHGLVVKTVGIVEPLRAALAPIEGEIALAFVFGSVAKGANAPEVISISSW